MEAIRDKIGRVTQITLHKEEWEFKLENRMQKMKESLVNTDSVTNYIILDENRKMT